MCRFLRVNIKKQAAREEFMKGIKKSFKVLAVSLTVLCTAIFSSVYVMDRVLPDKYMVVEGQEFSINSVIPVEVDFSQIKQSGRALGQSASGGEYSANLKLLGLVPIKSVTAEIVDELYVEPLGEPFGVKIYTSGVIVVGFSKVDADSGEISPAEAAGIKEGDNIISVGGYEVNSNSRVAEIIENSGGNPVTIKLIRGDKTIYLDLTPALSAGEGKYKAGLWVRDSSAGIGTLTFYSPSLNMLAGLGHGICDSDTDELLPLNTGEIVDAEIFGLEKGVSGAPGELKGRFTGEVLGNLLINGETGVYGAANVAGISDNLIRIAMKQEVKTGAAVLYCTIDGETPKAYKCEIEKVHFNDDNLTQNMIIKVTDPELIAKTGGIVQGMSGSPIIQDGKLIGAITHVFIGEPTRGYGIFAETMYNTAISVETGVKHNIS